MEELVNKLTELEDKHERLKEELARSRANIRTVRRTIITMVKKADKIKRLGETE